MGVKFDRLIYGGDYNPDQWLEYPDAQASPRQDFPGAYPLP